MAILGRVTHIGMIACLVWWVQLLSKLLSGLNDTGLLPPQERRLSAIVVGVLLFLNRPHPSPLPPAGEGIISHTGACVFAQGSLADW